MKLMAYLTLSGVALLLSACADAPSTEAAARYRHVHTAWGQHTLVPAGEAAEAPKYVHAHTPAGHSLTENPNRTE